MTEHAARPHPFDDAMSIQSLGDGRWIGRTHPSYWNMAGPFGGVTGAVMLRAVLDHPERLGRPVALTVNFCGALTEGEFEIVARLVRGGRSTQHWTVEMRQGDRGVATTASVVMAAERQTWGHAPAVMPQVPPAREVPVSDMTGRPAWTRALEMRFVEGLPDRRGRLETPAEGRAVLWVRDAPERLLDYPALASLSDSFFVKIIQVRGDVPPVATVSLTTYFLADEAEMAAQGARPVLGVCDVRAFRHGFNDQAGELWSDTGQLLATTQVVWWKE